MSDSSNKTTDHDTVKQWVESRDGFPATVKDTKENGEPGLLRIAFPGYGGDDDALERIEWAQFFEAFEENNLAFVYQEGKDSDESRFCKLVSR